MKLTLLPPAALALAAGALIVPSAQAQIYRSIDAQGRVTFTDTPNAVARAIAPGQDQATAGTGLAALPYELRQVQARYPVTLYAGPQCAPCDLGRILLTQRGIPFTEKTVASAEDIDALRRLASSGELPVLTVGTKQLKGYEQAEWAQYLDAAGYPATSHLPAGWQPATPTALAPPLTRAAEPDTAAESQAATPTEAEPEAIAPARTTDNPTGIRF